MPSAIASRIAAHSVEAQSSWSGAYGRFARRLQDRNLRVGVEIGVAFGGHAESILMTTEVSTLYGVDPYLHLVGYDDPMNLPQEEFEELFKFTLSRLSRFGDRYRHVRATSEEAAAMIGEIDFVYIDADHTYDGVWRDLRVWFPKVRRGGLVGGHDYDHPNFPGVKRAVDELLGHFGMQATHDGEGVWWAEKPALSVAQQSVLAALRPSGMPIMARPRLFARIARKAVNLLHFR